jgi:hypothetical protein
VTRWTQRLGAVLSLAVASAAWGQGEVPTPLGMLVMLKVVTYDTHFAEHGQGDFVVLVPFEPAQADDAHALVQAGAGLETRRINDRALVFEAVPADELAPRLKSRAASAVLLPHALSGPGLERVLAVARAGRVYALSLVEAQVQAGATLGVGLANGRPQPLLNVAAAKAVGAEFPPSVLRLARAVQ